MHTRDVYGSRWTDWVRQQSGVSWNSLSENVGNGQRTVSEVMYRNGGTGWMSSAGTSFSCQLFSLFFSLLYYS